MSSCMTRQNSSASRVHARMLSTRPCRKRRMDALSYVGTKQPWILNGGSEYNFENERDCGVSFLREVGELQEELDEGVWTHVLLFRKVFTEIVETQNKHVQIRDETETNKKDNKLNYRKLKTFVLASYLSRSRAACDMSLLTSSVTCHSRAVGEGRSRIESTRSSRRFLSSFLKHPQHCHYVLVHASLR